MQKEKKIVSQSSANKCPECGSSNFIHDYDTGETVCGDCGLVLSELMIDKGPEWRAYTREEKIARSRVGAPTTYSIHDKGLSTTIGGPFGVYRDAFGKKLPLKTRLQMWRLRKWQTRSRVQSSTERNLTQATTELNRLCDRLSIPDLVKERAAIIYRKALRQRLIRGRSIETMVAAALYAACRDSGIPRTLKEIAGEDRENRNIIARYYRLLLREFDLQMPISDPVDCISKIAETVGISGKTQGLAVRILREAQAKRISIGKGPMGLAAAALYIACLLTDEKNTQREIADVAKVTEVTIRNRYKKLAERLGLKIPSKSEKTRSFLFWA